MQKHDVCNHGAEGCASCSEVEFFKRDLRAQMAHAKGRVPDKSFADAFGRVEQLCASIDAMRAHVARVAAQEKFWPDMLAELRVKKDYYQVLIKSDYWKKFEGTVSKLEKCKTHPKQSIETHSAWYGMPSLAAFTRRGPNPNVPRYLLPPREQPGVKWSTMPEGHELVEPEQDGFRGFVVEFINIISDVVVQDG